MIPRLRIVAWNLQQGLAAKAERLLSLQPDIAVIPECAADVEAIGDLAKVCWVGRNAAKGLGVFARSELGGRLDGAHDPRHEYYVPVDFDAISFRLLAVWAMHYQGSEGTADYVRTHKALEAYSRFLADGDLVVGDFNDSPFFDGPRRPHWARTQEILESAGFRSLYHHSTGEDHGAEALPTLYFRRHRNEPFHIDYAFLRTDRLDDVIECRLGTADEWLAHSDHMPLLLELALPGLAAGEMADRPLHLD